MNTRFAFLDVGQRDAAIEFLRQQWQPQSTPAPYLRFVRTLHATVWGRQCWRLPVLQGAGGRIVAAMSLYDLDYRLGARRLRLGGIGSLRVHPDERRQGLATRFLGEVHAALKGEGHDGMLLFSSIGADFYRRLGYELLPALRLEARLAGGPAPPTDSLIRPFERADLPAVRNLFNTSSALQSFAALRDDSRWDVDLLMPEVRVRELGGTINLRNYLVGEREGRVVSYLRSRLKDEEQLLSVMEAGFEVGAKDDIAALLHEAAERQGGQRASRLEAIAPSRFANLCGCPDPVWQPETAHLPMALSFGGFAVPSDEDRDLRHLWPTDGF